MSSSTPPAVSVDAVTSEVQARVRESLRVQLLSHGASDLIDDPRLFADLDRLVRDAIRRAHPSALLLPELLGDPSTWRIDTAMRYGSHRSAGVGGLFIFVKQRLLMPLFRWLFEYSHDNFERQRRVNDVLFACVQELALENARLRRDIERLSPK